MPTAGNNPFLNNAQRFDALDAIAGRQTIGMQQLDLSSAGIKRRYLHIGPDITITNFAGVANGARTVGGATIDFSINGGGSIGTLTFPVGGGAGDDEDASVPDPVLTDGDVVELTVGGTNAASIAADCTLQARWLP